MKRLFSREVKNKTQTMVMSVLIAVFVLSGVLLVVIIDKNIQRNNMVSRNANLQKYHQKALLSFQNGIDQLAALVAGMHAFVHNSEEVPGERKFRQYLVDQLDQIHFEDSLVVSFIDTNHVFVYSVTTWSLRPNNLKGKKVDKLRDKAEMDRLENLLKSEGLVLFPPLNLIEKFVGIPINFRVKKEGIVLGYYAPILNFESVIEKVYNELPSDEIVFRFATGDGIEFDRKTVYDGTKVYTEEKDPEYFRNFSIPKEDFLTAKIDSYGRTFEIGIAYKTPYERSRTTTLFIYSILGLILLASLLFIGLSALQYRTKVNNLLRKQNEALRQYNLALNSFYNASSHDLKEPLRGIGSFTTLLKRRYGNKLDKKADEYIDYIVKNVNRMYQVLEKTRDYTSIFQRKDFKITTVNLNEIVLGLVLEFNSKEEDEDKVEFNISTLPDVQGNHEMILSLFYHLIENAIKFNTSEQKIIDLGYTEHDDFYEFWIRDNGVGIPEKYARLIFEPFQMLDKINYEGVGLSLAACQLIVEYHGGTIKARPNKESPGSTIIFTIPRKTD